MLGIKTGGLMEDPIFQVKDLRTVVAQNLRDAKEKYAILTNLVTSKAWDAEKQTYFGWPIVQIIE
jgi:hypothetical protein